MSEAWVVVDLGFGDAGKGTVTDFLVRDRAAHTVVRWHGGAQAGHRVVTPDGRAHVFSQLGAGSFVPGVRTHLTADFVLHPPALLLELTRLRAAGVPDALERLTLDPAARVITPFTQAANRLRELARGGGAHGTCGVGFGETVRLSLEAPELTIRARDLYRPAALPARLRRLQSFVRDENAPLAASLRDHPGARPELAALEDPGVVERWIEAIAPLLQRDRLGGDDALEARLRGPGAVVFEGAQGALLDEWRGFHPHTTWSTCTSHGASALLDRLGHDGARTRLGVSRSYATRHGAGPMPSEDAALARLPEAENDDRGWQGAFRRGWLDLVLLRYALAVSPVDALALTHLDRVEAGFALAEAHRAPAAASPSLAEVDPRDPRRVLGLRPAARLGDLAHQARLTGLLGALEPELRQLEEPLVAHLEGRLGLPVALTSSGPSANDKRWVRPRRSLGRGSATAAARSG